MKLINTKTGKDSTREGIEIIRKSLEEAGYTFVNTTIKIDGDRIEKV